MLLLRGCSRPAYSSLLLKCDRLPNLQSSPRHAILTSLTGATQVPRPRAVADVAVPALPADSIVLAGVGQALLGRLSGAGGLHTHCSLGLSQPPDVLALPVHKQVSDAAHITVVQQSSPYLCKRPVALSRVEGILSVIKYVL